MMIHKVDVCDSILSDDESDKHFDKVSDVPQELINKTLNSCDIAFDLEMRRNADVETLYKEHKKRNTHSIVKKIHISIAKTFKLRCPYNMIPFKNVPGYEQGYGCPVCKSITFYHLRLDD